LGFRNLRSAMVQSVKCERDIALRMGHTFRCGFPFKVKMRLP
jgi:hypothetical protein